MATTKKKTQKYDIQDFEARGTLEQIAKSLGRLAFEISSADPEEIDDNNDEELSFYDDGVVSCSLFPMA